MTRRANALSGNLRIDSRKIVGTVVEFGMSLSRSRRV